MIERMSDEKLEQHINNEAFCTICDEAKRAREAEARLEKENLILQMQVDDTVTLIPDFEKEVAELKLQLDEYERYNYKGTGRSKKEVIREMQKTLHEVFPPPVEQVDSEQPNQ